MAHSWLCCVLLVFAGVSAAVTSAQYNVNPRFAYYYRPYDGRPVLVRAHPRAEIVYDQQYVYQQPAPPPPPAAAPQPRPAAPAHHRPTAAYRPHPPPAAADKRTEPPPRVVYRQPARPKPTQKDRRSKYFFAGVFEDYCSDDGLYYRDESSFVVCVHGTSFVQPCPPGTRNSDLTELKAGYRFGYSDFCTDNLVDRGFNGYGSDTFDTENNGVLKETYEKLPPPHDDDDRVYSGSSDT